LASTPTFLFIYCPVFHHFSSSPRTSSSPEKYKTEETAERDGEMEGFEVGFNGGLEFVDGFNGGFWRKEKAEFPKVK